MIAKKYISPLQYITNGTNEVSILNEVKEVLSAGADWIQLRMKDTSPDIVRPIAAALKGLCSGKAVFILNDFVDLVSELNLDGVHLGKEDLTVLKAREILGEEKIIGGTANTYEDCLNLQMAGVDYIGLGPLRYTNTKKKLSPVLDFKGYQKILPMKDEYGWSIGDITVPVVAIGGIIIDDIKILKEVSRVHGIAVHGLIAQAPDRMKLIDELKSELWIS